MFSLLLAGTSLAQTSREVVRDPSGRIVQTIDHRTEAGGTVRSTTRDAMGRVIGTAVTRQSATGTARTEI
ncbi:MAG: hypothetical protein ACO3RK_08965, partial [Luteolibacter sp.]